MPRELRPRKTRQRYTDLSLDDRDEQEPGPSQPRSTVQEDRGGNTSDIGSDFAPPAPEEIALSDEDGSDSQGTGRASGSGSEGDFPAQRSNKKKRGAGPSKTTAKTKAKAKGKAKATEKSKAKGKRAAPAPTLVPAAPARQAHALPNPNVHHRHRPVPLFRPAAAAARVERLLRAPRLFAPNELAPTLAYASSPALTRRVGKAWGASVGAGPVWPVLEDLGWFRESAAKAQEEEEAGVDVAGGGKGNKVLLYAERARRPRVHARIEVPRGGAGDRAPLPLLRAEDGVAYLPTQCASDHPGAAATAPPVSCDFGPFGGQTNIKLETLQAQKLSQFLPESRAHVFNAGASVWGLDWCPIHPDDRAHCSYKYYLAVAPFPSRTHSPSVGVKVARPSRACMQLWSLGPSPGAEGSDDDDDKGEMRCEMVLCIDSGPALELKWCPLPSHDPLSGPSPNSPRKLGLLAGVFEDGSLSVYVVPYPPDLASAQPATITTDPIFLKIPEPILCIEHDEAAFCTLDWGNSEMIAAGLANGAIVVYNIGRALRSPSEPILPMGYFCVHQSAIRALTWVRVPDRHGNGPTVIASGGYDGLQCLTDIRDLGGHVFNRTRDAINSIAYSPYLSAVVTIDHENTIKSYSVSPSTLGRGHALMDPSGPVWDVSASDYHPQLAVGSADGTCYTTNGLRAARRGGYVPFLVHRVYQLDYSRNADRYRMLDRLKPREMAERPEGGGGAWPTSVGVQRVAWHCGAGLAAAGLLASATGSGLCRVDFLEGRWFRDRVPYERVEAVRMEEDCMDLDEPEDNNDSS
ncbi:hypothetical protein BJY52DRAFT_1186406 [Lactarius psammicola]|nr:hypothetical protein BJY52DRAFT_1186406 [Lactarius psammicola]